jgi:hypothetical protein
MPPRWAAPGSSAASAARRSTATGEALDPRDVSRPSGGALGREALDAPCRRAETDVGGAIGREALCRHGGEQRPLKPSEPGEALHREARDAGDEVKAQGWAPVVIDTNGNGKLDDYVEPNQVVDPTKDKPIAAGAGRIPC